MYTSAGCAVVIQGHLEVLGTPFVLPVWPHLKTKPYTFASHAFIFMKPVV